MGIVVFWIVMPCNMVDENQRFGSRDASIFKVEDAHFNLEDGGGTTSETLVSNHHTTLRNKPED
jgi:hypothetical protein